MVSAFVDGGVYIEPALNHDAHGYVQSSCSQAHAAPSHLQSAVDPADFTAAGPDTNATAAAAAGDAIAESRAADAAAVTLWRAAAAAAAAAAEASQAADAAAEAAEAEARVLYPQYSPLPRNNSAVAESDSSVAGAAAVVAGAASPSPAARAAILRARVARTAADSAAADANVAAAAATAAAHSTTASIIAGDVAQRSVTSALPALCLGHHSGDAVETTLMRLLRGSALPGLAGPAAAATVAVAGATVIAPTRVRALTPRTLDGGFVYAAAREPALLARAVSATMSATESYGGVSGSHSGGGESAGVLPRVRVLRPLLGFSKERLIATLEDRIVRMLSNDPNVHVAYNSDSDTATDNGNVSAVVVHAQWASDGRLLLTTSSPLSSYSLRSDESDCNASASDADGTRTVQSKWVEDPSNANLAFDRVRARLALFPSTIPQHAGASASAATSEAVRESSHDAVAATLTAGVAALSRRAAAFTAATGALLSAHSVVVSPHGHVFISARALLHAIAAQTPPNVEAGATSVKKPVVSTALLEGCLSRAIAVVAAAATQPRAEAVSALRTHFFSHLLRADGLQTQPQHAEIGRAHV